MSRKMKYFMLFMINYITLQLFDSTVSQNLDLAAKIRKLYRVLPFYFLVFNLLLSQSFLITSVDHQSVNFRNYQNDYQYLLPVVASKWIQQKVTYCLKNEQV